MALLLFLEVVSAPMRSMNKTARTERTEMSSTRVKAECKARERACDCNLRMVFRLAVWPAFVEFIMKDKAGN